jgi:hypothetical protein
VSRSLGRCDPRNRFVQVFSLRLLSGGWLCGTSILGLNGLLGEIVKTERIFGELQITDLEIELDADLRTLLHYISHCADECAQKQEKLGF